MGHQDRPYEVKQIIRIVENIHLKTERELFLCPLYFRIKEQFSRVTE